MEQPNKPTLGGYLELLVKVMISMVLLIFMGVFYAALVLLIPFMLSLTFVLALAAAGAFIFSWNYVYIGTIFFLILIGIAID